jgi:DNA-binding protein HU-beta
VLEDKTRKPGGEAVNKAELVNALADRLGGNKKAAGDALEAVIDTVYRAVSKGEKVTITGFGSFEKVQRAARTGRNPATGQTIKVKKSVAPKFRPGQEFKNVISGAKKLPRLAATKAAAAPAASRTTATAKKAPAKAAAKRTTATKASTTRKTATRSAPTKAAKSSAAKTLATKPVKVPGKVAKSRAAKTLATKATTTTKAAPARKTAAKKATTKRAAAKR